MQLKLKMKLPARSSKWTVANSSFFMRAPKWRRNLLQTSLWSCQFYVMMCLEWHLRSFLPFSFTCCPCFVICFLVCVLLHSCCVLVFRSCSSSCHVLVLVSCFFQTLCKKKSVWTLFQVKKKVAKILKKKEEKKKEKEKKERNFGKNRQT